MHVAIVGTGTMGFAMATRLVRDGHTVTAFNRTRERALPLGEFGVTVVDSVWEAVEDADVVITATFDVRSTLDLAARFLGAMKDGAVWMQTATVGPAGMLWIADLANQFDARLIDAPVLGSKSSAEDGSLVVLLSGESSAMYAVGPVCDTLGSKTVTVGSELGEASALKLACNAWIASITAALAQSVVMCRELGVDPELFLEAINDGPTGSEFARRKGAMMLAGDYEPSFAIDGLLKDLALMLDAVDPEETPLLPVLRGAYGAASAGGHGKQDIAAVVAPFSG
jgi:3-hydroxyisobutyrate dehydrogenase